MLIANPLLVDFIIIFTTIIIISNSTVISSILIIILSLIYIRATGICCTSCTEKAVFCVLYIVIIV